MLELYAGAPLQYYLKLGIEDTFVRIVHLEIGLYIISTLICSEVFCDPHCESIDYGIGLHVMSL